MNFHYLFDVNVLWSRNRQCIMNPISDTPSLQGLPSGMTFVWDWSDKEIEKPPLLRTRLEAILSEGFSSVLACLGNTRYELTDKKVVRAAAQTSQWAKKRGLAFWFQMDPRKASRSILTAAEEHTQFLFGSREHAGHLHPNRIRIRKNRFAIRMPFPQPIPCSFLQEAALRFEPSGLERAFMFRMRDDRVASGTVRDVTQETRFRIDASRSILDVFGEVRVPSDETWIIAAFPRFDANIIDYAGRESVDRWMPFIEALFDSGLILDGFFWGDPGFSGDDGRFPFSLSLANSFLAEYGYDIRDHLPELVLDFDDASHVSVRLDYARLLSNAVSSAVRDLYGMVHAFFDDTETLGSMHLDTSVFHAGDPWQKLSFCSSAAAPAFSSSSRSDTLFAFIEAKSMGVCSGNQRAFAFFDGKMLPSEVWMWWMDTAALFSVQWLVQGRCPSVHSPRCRGQMEAPFERLNRRFAAVMEVTGYKLPEADTLVIWPFETLAASRSDRSREMRRCLQDLVLRLVLGGVQLDVVSSLFLKKARLDESGLQYRNRIYRNVIYPYPEVMDPFVLDLVSRMVRADFPILLGGSKPEWTSKGERIPQDFQTVFDPRDVAFTEQWRPADGTVFEIPESGLGSVIQTGTETLLLFSPKETGGTVSGRARFGETRFHVGESSGLTVYRLKEEKISRVL